MSKNTQGKANAQAQAQAAAPTPKTKDIANLPDYLQDAVLQDMITLEEAYELSTGTDDPTLCNLP